MPEESKGSFVVTGHSSRKLAVILHADVVGSTALVRRNEATAHDRIQDAFRRFSKKINVFDGVTHELRGDALLAEFNRASDAVSASLSFQAENTEFNDSLDDDIKPEVRIGISLGEVIIADDTLTGPDVVLAQRIEQLAQPGGICVSAAVQQAVPRRLPFEFQDLGEQEVKGFEEPVRVFSVALWAGEQLPLPEAAANGTLVARTGHSNRRWIAGGMVILLVIAGGLAVGLQSWSSKLPPATVAEEPQAQPLASVRNVEEARVVDTGGLPIATKPSIAVLPFTNMSDDPSQEYFVDGMTEDLITDLAKINSIFVIARNTMFTFKNKSVVVPEVAKVLGVKYVLEGSVRRVGDLVRINTQLIDGASGTHLWAERYDGSLTDIFALQDRVTGEIISALKIALTPDEQERQEQKRTNNPDALDAYLRGWQLYRRYTPEDFVEAIPFFERAVELDPDYGQAWAALASLYWISYQKSYAWTLIVNPNFDISVSWQQTRLKAGQYLKQAMKNPTPLAHQVESQMSWDYRQFDKALNEAQLAIALDPNDPQGHQAMAWALIFSGRAGEAIASGENGMRLDPYYPAPHLFVLGMAHLLLQKYTQAEAELKRALRLSPENKNLYLPLAVTYAYLNKQEEARVALNQYTDFFIYYAPKLETYIEWWPFKREADIRFFGGGLIKAGLCCEEQLEAYVSRVRQGGTLE